MNRKQWTIVLGIGTVAFTVLMELIDPSHVSHGPTILDFEFAATRSHAAQIVAEWGAKGRSAAHLSLLLDYGYMLSYGGFFTLAGLATRDLARKRGWRRLGTAGAIVPLLATAAALFDASENVFLLLVLKGHGGEYAPLIATICSSVKFTLIAVSIVYVLWGLAARAQRDPAPARDDSTQHIG